MPTGLILRDGGALNLRSLDRILHGVVFFADRVTIRSTYVITESDPDVADEIEWKIDGLRESGAVQLWAHEYEVDDRGFASDPTDSHAIHRPADLVVEAAALRESIAEIDDVLRATKDVELDQPGALRQGTAEVVEYRGELANLAISAELNQDGILTNPASRAALVTSGFRRLDDRFEVEVVRNVVSQLQLGPLWRLTVDEVQTARSMTKDFRTLLNDSMLKLARGITRDITPESVASEIVERYRHVMAELGRKHLSGDLTAEAGWDVVGAVIPASIPIKYGWKFFRGRRADQDLRPFLLLTHLQRTQRRHDGGTGW